jgi:hypothetical protein
MLDSSMAADETEGSAEGPGSGPVPRSAIITFSLVAVGLGIVTLYSLWAFWPSSGASMTPLQQHLSWFGLRLGVSREFLFFLTVALAGGLGGLIHTIRSFVSYVGNRQLVWSWLPYNLLLPLVGALAGTVFYLVLRAGLFSPSTSVQQASPFGFAAISMLAGLFSPQAFEKLKQLAGHVFTDVPQESNALIGRQQPSDVSTGVGTAATRDDAPAGDSET